MVARILALLEDPELHAAMMGRFKRARHEVRIVQSLAQAKQALQEYSFDLIISEVHLENGGSAFDFLTWVRSDPARRPIPFVLLSINQSDLGRFLEDDVRKAARHLGAAKYISMKRLDPVLLAEELAPLLPGVPRLMKSGNDNSQDTDDAIRA